MSKSDSPPNSPPNSPAKSLAPLPGSVRHRAPVPKDACPMALTAELLGDKWSLLILREAFYGVQRYDDMRRDLGAPRAMLTDRLAKLTAKGLLQRYPYQEDGDRVRHAYRLAPAGRDLTKLLIAMAEWGEAHLTHTPAPARAVDKTCGADVRLALLTEDGQVVAQEDLRLSVRT